MVIIISSSHYHHTLAAALVVGGGIYLLHTVLKRMHMMVSSVSVHTVFIIELNIKKNTHTLTHSFIPSFLLS